MRFGSFGGLAALLTILAAGSAQAQCSGGKFLKGGYGVIIYGATASGSTQAMAGALLADGNCGLTGKLSGNIGGTEMTAAAVTGSYSVNQNLTGGISLTVAGAAPISFAVNWVVRHRQLAGIENDGQGFVQIDAKLQQTTHFGPQTLQGSFAYLCSTPANQPSLLLSVVFDGVGGATATGSQYQGPTLVPWGSAEGSYTVNTDGSYTLNVQDNAGNDHLFGGVIDSANYNAPLAEIAENGAGTITGPAHCVGQKQ